MGRFRWEEADEAEHAAAVILVAAETRVVRIAMRADLHPEDVLFPNAQSDKLEPGGGSEVEEVYPGTIGSRAEQRPGKARFVIEIPDILTDFIAPPADARPEGRQDGAGIGGIAVPHAADGLLENTQARAFPAAVDRGDDTLFLIDKEHGEAIGRLDDKKQAGKTGDQGIPAEPPPRHSVDEVNDVGMNLFEEEGMEMRPLAASSEVSGLPMKIAKAMLQKGDVLESWDCFEPGKPGFQPPPVP